MEPTCEKMNDAWDEFMHCLNQQQAGIAKEITEKIQQICAPLQGQFPALLLRCCGR